MTFFTGPLLSAFPFAFLALGLALFDLGFVGFGFVGFKFFLLTVSTLCRRTDALPANQKPRAPTAAISLVTLGR